MADHSTAHVRDDVDTPWRTAGATIRTDRPQTPGTSVVGELPGAAATLRRAALAAIALTSMLLLLGCVGRLVVFDSTIGNAEADLMSWVAGHRIGVLDTAATIGSSLTDTWTVIGILVGAIAVLMVTGRQRFAALMAIAISLEFMAFLIVGQVIGRARPDVESLHSVPSTPSFPSGHVAAAVVAYGSLALIARTLAPYRRSPGRVWLVPIVVAAIVAASRVYEGVHYPTDVAAGFLLGVGAVLGAAYATRAAEPVLAEPVPAEPFEVSAPCTDES